MRDAVIVSTARTPIGKAYRGAFNITRGATLGSFSLAAAVERSKLSDRAQVIACHRTLRICSNGVVK